MAAIRGAAMSAVFIDAPPKTRNRYICEVLRRECARWPVASREDRHVSEGPKSRSNAERAPRRGRWARGAAGVGGGSGGRLDPGGRRREDLGFGGGPAQVPEPQARKDQEQARGAEGHDG